MLTSSYRPRHTFPRLAPAFALPCPGRVFAHLILLLLARSAIKAPCNDRIQGEGVAASAPDALSEASGNGVLEER
jgi:hypothetical protein